MLRKVEASTYIRVPGKLAFAVLKDFGAYQEWNSDISESRVFASEGDVSIVEFIVPAIASGKLILEFVESPSSWLLFNQVDRLREDGLAGRWDLSEANDGDGVIVKGTVTSRDSLFRVGLRRRLRDFVDRTLAGLRSRCLMLAAAGSLGYLDDRRKILEIHRVGGRLELSLDGTTFVLDPAAERETP